MRPWVLCAVFLISQPVFGQFFWSSPATDLDFGPSIQGQEVSRLLTILEEKSWQKNAEEASLIAAKIPLNSRYTLYDKYKVSGLWGLLNLYFVGSLIQGDPGTTVVLGGGVVLGEAALIYSSTLNDRPERSVWVGTGGALVVGAMVYGLVRPWFFADEQNRALKTVLFGAP